MEITLRLEEEKDYRAVEELTREAFWNIHFPGCSEHLLIHNLRNTKEFIRELDFVAIVDAEIVGNIVSAEAKILNAETEYTVLTFGPVSVLPAYQNNGIGTKLINRTKQAATEKGYKAIAIYGYPEYYKKFGFTASKKYEITNKKHAYPAALLVLELYPNALCGINGAFDEGKIYETDERDVEEFDKGFSRKEKEVTKSQEKFLEIANQYL